MVLRLVAVRRLLAGRRVALRGLVVVRRSPVAPELGVVDVLAVRRGCRAVRKGLDRNGMVALADRDSRLVRKQGDVLLPTAGVRKQADRNADVPREIARKVVVLKEIVRNAVDLSVAARTGNRRTWNLRLLPQPWLSRNQKRLNLRKRRLRLPQPWIRPTLLRKPLQTTKSHWPTDVSRKADWFDFRLLVNCDEEFFYPAANRLLIRQR